MFPAEGGPAPVGNHVLCECLCQTLQVSSWPTALARHRPALPAPQQQGTWELVPPRSSQISPTHNQFEFFFLWGGPFLVDTLKPATYKPLRPVFTIHFLSFWAHNPWHITDFCPLSRTFISYFWNTLASKSGLAITINVNKTKMPCFNSATCYTERLAFMLNPPFTDWAVGSWGNSGNVRSCWVSLIKRELCLHACVRDFIGWYQSTLSG